MDTFSLPKNKLIVTTSWDDGDILDTRVASLLTRYDVKGTFYITKEYRKERLCEDDIRSLARSHEVGAHTLTHPDLRALSDDKKREEIAGGKAWLESVLGGEVTMFCYPRGYYDESVAVLAREARYKGARTTALGITTAPTNPYKMGTTLQVYPYPLRKRDKSRYYWGKLLQPYLQRGKGLRNIGVPVWAMYSWSSATKAAFDAALIRGGIFHLWGHSWEVERYGMWEELEDVLRYISHNPHCSYITNGDLIQS